MNDDELRRAYEARTGVLPRASPPTPDELQRVAAREGPEDERLAILERALADPQARRDLEVLRAIAAAASDTAAVRRRVRVPLALAAALVLVLAGTLVLRRIWTGETVRGSEAEGAPAPVSPAPGVTLRAGNIEFLWRSLPDARRYRLDVLSDAGSVAAETETRDTTVVVALPAPGPGGASYRWSVVALLPDGVEVASRPRRLTIQP
jgi:hypothetical protein